MRRPPAESHASSLPAHPFLLPAPPSHHPPEGRLTRNHLGEDQQRAGLGRVASSGPPDRPHAPRALRPPLPTPAHLPPGSSGRGTSPAGLETKCFQTLQTPGHQKQAGPALPFFKQCLSPGAQATLCPLHMYPEWAPTLGQATGFLREGQAPSRLRGQTHCEQTQASRGRGKPLQREEEAVTSGSCCTLSHDPGCALGGVHPHPAPHLAF